MSRIRILLVEDETLIAKDLKNRLESKGFEIIGITRSYKDSISMLELSIPDLIIIDIKLSGDEDGINLAEHIIQKKLEVPFIYLTSLVDKSTISRAKPTHPSAYIVKPFNEYELDISIELAIHNFANRQESEKLEAAQDTHYLLPNRIFVKNNFKMERVDYKDIDWLEASDNYSTIVTSGKKYTLCTTLNTIHEKLNNPLFVRVHKGFVVNIDKVSGIEGNMLFIDQHTVPIGRSYRENVLHNFNLV